MDSRARTRRIVIAAFALMVVTWEFAHGNTAIEQTTPDDSDPLIEADAPEYLHALGLPGVVLSPPENAVLRIHAIVDTQEGSRIFREHHDAAHAGRGDRIGVPMGLLVTDRRQQPPVDTGLFGGLLEVTLQLRETVTNLFNQLLVQGPPDHVPVGKTSDRQ